jgi:hypothetical protein
MLTIEQYITQMKKKDKLDEFNFKNHAENMSATIKYVMDYFTNYLDPEAYDYENIKIEQTASKIEQEIGTVFPKSKTFIVDYYKKNKTRIDKVLKSWIEELKYVDLFYCIEDYENAINKFCESTKMRGTGTEQYKDKLILLAQEVKENKVDIPSISGFKYLDNALITWVKDTYREYGVNLFEFAQDYIYHYYEEYVEVIYKKESETFYYINRYNHRYNNNPFGMDEMYKENSHRPFIFDRKGEVEMLLMYVWIFDNANDSDYWSEYVNLCKSTGRVSIVGHINILTPVTNNGNTYPEDVKSTVVYAETTTGSIKGNPDSAYILRLYYDKDNDIAWKDIKRLNEIINNLHETFAKYGIPLALELLSPMRSQTYNEEEFFTLYRILEKSMKKYTNMKIVLINGPHRQSSKPKYLMQSAEDIVRIKDIAKNMKFKLKFAVDISKLINRKTYRGDFADDFNKLSEIRNAIVGVHLSRNNNRNNSYNNRHYKDGNYYLNKFEYPPNSDLLGCISALMNDNMCRYFVPDGISNTIELEELVDDLLRGGFSFRSQEGG